MLGSSGFYPPPPSGGNTPCFEVRLDNGIILMLDCGTGMRALGKSSVGELMASSFTSTPLNHPQGCVAFRVGADGGSLVCATDTEPGSKIHDQNVRNISQGADLLIYDCQYTLEQFQNEKKGWGHSSWVEGVKIAKEAGVGRLLMFHHDPDHHDDFLNR